MTTTKLWKNDFVGGKKDKSDEKLKQKCCIVENAENCYKHQFNDDTEISSMKVKHQIKSISTQHTNHTSTTIEDLTPGNFYLFEAK